MERRSFLKGLLGLSVAPAICKAENLMKIVVPSQELYVPDFKVKFSATADYLTPTNVGMDFGRGDFTVEAWIKPSVEQWNHISRVHADGATLSYVNGVLVTEEEFDSMGFKVVRENDHVTLGFEKAPKGDIAGGCFNGLVSDLRVTNTARYPVGRMSNPQQSVEKFESRLNRGVQAMESFVDRAEAFARQETPSGLLATLLGRV